MDFSFGVIACACGSYLAQYTWYLAGSCDWVGSSQATDLPCHFHAVVLMDGANLIGEI